MQATSRADRGFILGEVLVVLVVSSLVVTALLAGLIALVRGLQPPAVKLEGEALPVAPTFGAFPSAVRLHERLTQRATAARAVYVFGGQHPSLGASAGLVTLPPLKGSGLPVVYDFSRGLPLDAKGFYDRYAAELGDTEVTASPEDFSLLIIGPKGDGIAVTALAQVRRRQVNLSDGTAVTPYIVREVRLWDVDEGPYRYAFAEKPAQTASVFTGAIHTWVRFQPEVVAEEGPACVVFPDPWTYGGRAGSAGEPPPFSRFSYFFAVSS